MSKYLGFIQKSFAARLRIKLIFVHPLPSSPWRAPPVYILVHNLDPQVCKYFTKTCSSPLLSALLVQGLTF